MKSKCKNVNLRDCQSLIPAIEDVVFRHFDRYDFRSLLFEFGMSADDYYQFIRTKERCIVDPVLETIAEECVKRIVNRNLGLKPVQIRIMADKSTGKIRQIGKETAMQQIFDYIAFYAAKEVFEKRIVPEQASSIKNRGQVYGQKIISGWVKKDIACRKFIEKHPEIQYQRKCKYFVISDITKCYPSAKLESFMKFFSKEVANKDVVWLWHTLLKSHQVDGYSGFMIGSLVSQWAVQYMITFVYRYVRDLHYERRGKKYKCVDHMLVFMDDMLMTSSNRKQLKSAVRKMRDYLNNELGFKIKENWQIHDIDQDPIDMMGYVIFANGHVEIRGRDFIKARRMALRYRLQDSFLTMRQCKRILSYKGFFMYSNSKNVRKKYGFDQIFDYAAEKISVEERRKNGKPKRKKQ